MKKWIVEVTALSGFEDMDQKDLDPQGNCLVDGAYRLHADGDLAEAEEPQAAALDLFHSLVPISGLEHFDVVIREETAADAGDDWLRQDLGCHSDLPGAPAPGF